MSDFTKEDNELIQREFESLRLAALKRCASQEEYEGVIKAFEFANEAHKGVRRRSGEPYIIHPIAVAKIVVQEIGLGYKSIVTALLHDVVEDTEYTVEDVERLFGAKIASLVDGLTKIKSAMDTKMEGGKEQTTLQAENFKRILLTLNDDVRVILIKLADRLHNLRTIESMPERKQDKILSETMYIFIPLAHRLGLYSIKSEMENIWLKFRQPDQYAQICAKIAEYTQTKGVIIDNFIEPISKLLEEAHYKFTITKRIKTPYSIWNKMQVKGIPFEEIYDLFAVRIIFTPKKGSSERKQCWDIYSLISEDYLSNTDRIRDWVSTPKSNGYEALHCTLMNPQGGWVEVQIRTVRMNAIAEKGVAAHWNYKGGKIANPERDMDDWLNMVREVLESPDVNALEFLDKFHTGLLSKEIYVFTPAGESKRMEKGATALDFAYHIHSEIGNQAIAAKVNLKLVPLSYQLRNGDMVEIITADSQKPQREWLKFVKTAKARNIILDSLKGEVKDSIKRGQEKLEKALDSLGVKLHIRVLKKLIDEFKVSNKDELYSKIGSGLIDLTDLEKILKKNKENKLVKYWKLTFSSDKEEKEEVEESSTDEGKEKKIDRHKDYLLKENPLDKTLTYKTADCCNPIPGDPIIGFLDDNGEVVIHKKVCPVAMALASSEGGKIINAKWTKHTILSFLARIELKGIDRLGIVNEITKYITLQLSVNIRKLFFETHDGVFYGYIDLYVHNTNDLDEIIKTIGTMKGIESAKRVDFKDEE
ncbi:MAG: bifunctional (p)ppGpp synthetase/guanosine-3',5'-bis(diphosphate) 3'-pyrophosphohydrolase [Bacteroidales bacterium]|nr:bifunctional (p)ppGpp synthetase/guanosine-3',5'-bis(diphosphate) 3'-pyrophosphohydrolase [Bacteroidales bacterium]MBR5908223.1 bifunctional (p)ppGpp synthetase/guanosine-3',5'-bis(diphosphate) 3'-pyrophosphohydrolase [Bacteroidales bacterium]